MMSIHKNRNLYQLTRVFKLWVERSDMRLGPGVARELKDKHKKAHRVGHRKARIYMHWKEQGWID